MAFCAGGSLQGLCVTVAAGRAAVIDSASSFIRNAGMRTCVSRKPIIGCVATCTIRTKHACMEDRVGMAAYACR